jgi:hypothetical protein
MKLAKILVTAISITILMAAFTLVPAQRKKGNGGTQAQPTPTPSVFQKKYSKLEKGQKVCPNGSQPFESNGKGDWGKECPAGTRCCDNSSNK